MWRRACGRAQARHFRNQRVGPMTTNWMRPGPHSAGGQQPCGLATALPASWDWSAHWSPPRCGAWWRLVRLTLLGSPSQERGALTGLLSRGTWDELVTLTFALIKCFIGNRVSFFTASCPGTQTYFGVSRRALTGFACGSPRSEGCPGRPQPAGVTGCSGPPTHASTLGGGGLGSASGRIPP